MDPTYEFLRKLLLDSIPLSESSDSDSDYDSDDYDSSDTDDDFEDSDEEPETDLRHLELKNIIGPKAKESEVFFSNLPKLFL